MSKNRQYRILCCSCSSDIGYAVGKILHQYQKHFYLIGSDINVDSPSLLVYDRICQAPATTSDIYLEYLIKLVNKEEIDLIIPLSDYELRFYVDNNIESIANVSILKLNNNLLDIFLDKYKTIEFLKYHNMIIPWTLMVNENTNPIDLPCILKPIRGSGGQNVQIIDSILKTSKIKELKNKYIYQQLLIAEDEYTCCIYKYNNISHNIIMKRILKNGITMKATVINNHIIDNFLQQLSQKISFNGSINVQLKMINDTPMVFEINPRFSSTVRFRDLLGFHDLMWSIHDYLNIENNIHYIPQYNIIGYKTYEEIII
jgi:carbamoyl-phosphate synthase large subunit